MDQSWSQEHKKLIISPENLADWAKSQRAAGQVVVTTNGSFDLLHAGHLHMLFEAGRLGTLMVLLNTDESVRGYKSPDRPIIELKYRLQMVAALKCVDFVSYFDEPDPRRALTQIAPDLHVNSAEYGSDCIERQVVESHGGQIRLIDRIDGLSTSQIINKIEKCTSQPQ